MAETNTQPIGNGLATLASLALVAISFLQWQNAQRAAAEAQRNANLTQIRHDQIVALQANLAQEQREQTLIARTNAQAPLLTVAQCCNQVPVRIERSPEGGNLQLRKLDLKETRLLSGHTDFESRAESAFIAKVQNVGSGAAMSVKVHWKIDQVIRHDGQKIEVSEENINGYARPFTWPATIGTGNSAVFSHLPRFLEVDGQLQISHVRGTIRITCQDSMNKDHVFIQPFTLDTVYSPSAKDPIGQRLSFHFLEPDSRSSVLTAARPKFDTASSR